MTTLANVTVLLLLVIYNMVIVAALKLRREPATEQGTVYHAPFPLLLVGLVGNTVLAVYVVVDDWTSLLWCGGLIGVGIDDGNTRVTRGTELRVKRDLREQLHGITETSAEHPRHVRAAALTEDVVGMYLPAVGTRRH